MYREGKAKISRPRLDILACFKILDNITILRQTTRMKIRHEPRPKSRSDQEREIREGQEADRARLIQSVAKYATDTALQKMGPYLAGELKGKAPTSSEEAEMRRILQAELVPIIKKTLKWHPLPKLTIEDVEENRARGEAD